MPADDGAPSIDDTIGNDGGFDEQPMGDASQESDGSDLPTMDGDEPNDIGDDMEGSEGDDSQTDSEDDEIMSIINSLSIEDKAAVEKYAKSMADDDGDSQPSDMPMESRRNYFKNLVDETINSYLYDDDNDNRVERLPKEYKRFDSPFKSPYE